MMRTRVASLRSIGVGTVAVASLLAPLACSEQARPFERVVLIVVDTLRRDHVGAYGGEARTPTLDSLARDGAIFTNAVSNFHQTTMAMAAMFTGRIPALE